MPRILNIGHRGAAGHAPENTLAAIQRGIELGVDFVEIDVRRTADGVLVALHDATVNRTTNGKGRVDTLSLQTLKTFDAGKGERIPTVEEVLKTAAGRTGLMLELKAVGLAHLAVQAVRNAQFHSSVIYASFLHAELAHVRETAPEGTLMVLFDKLPSAPEVYAMQYHPTYVGLRHNTLTRGLIDAFHREKLLVCVYTANHPKDIKRVLSLGVDGVISDFPERIPAQ